MHRSFTFLSVLLILFCLLAVRCDAAEHSYVVSNTKFLQDGTEFTIRGININGPGMPGNHKVSLDVHLIADVWKFNLVRVSCSIRDVPNAAPKGKDAPDTLDDIVREFTDRGIVVLISPRDHVGGYYSDPPGPANSSSLTELAGWWIKTAEKYRSNPSVWFEPMADPGGREENPIAQQWMDSTERIVRTIRQTVGAPNIIVCCGGYRGCEDGNMGALPVVAHLSAILTYGPAIVKTFPNVAFDFSTLDGWETGGVARLNDFLDRVAEQKVAIFVAEYGLHNWADGLHGAEAVLAASKTRKLGHCAWQWVPDDRSCLCTTDNHNGGWDIDRTDGERPGNLSWLGDRVWIDGHVEPFHGPALDKTGWTATSFAPTMRKDGHYNRADQPLANYVIQEDYWRSDTGQEPGQWYQVDMGTKRSFTRVEFDTGAQIWDFPRAYELYVSQDGEHWGSPIASGKNEQSVMRLSFPLQNARFIKIVLTSKTWRQWFIGNFQVYAPFGATTPAPVLPAHEIELDPHGWLATASPVGWTDLLVPLRPLQYEWSRAASNTKSSPGDFYQIDMQQPKRFHKVVINCGRFSYEFMRGYELYASIDGSNWGKPIATGRGAPITTIQFTPITARYVRIIQTRENTSQWVITQMHVYGEQGAAINAAR